MLDSILSFARDRNFDGLRSLLPDLHGDDLALARVYVHFGEYENGAARDALRGLAWVLANTSNPAILSEAHLHSAHAYQLLGSLRHAESHFRKAVDVAPDEARQCDTMNGLARFFLDALAFHEARRHYASAAEACRGRCLAEVNSLAGVGISCLRVGDTREARSALGRADELATGLPCNDEQRSYLQSCLAELFAELGDFDEAEARLGSARELARSEWHRWITREAECRVASKHDATKAVRIAEDLQDGARESFPLIADRAVLLLCGLEPRRAAPMVSLVVHPSVRLWCLAELGMLDTPRARLLQSRMSSDTFEAVTACL